MHAAFSNFQVPYWIPLSRVMSVDNQLLNNYSEAETETTRYYKTCIAEVDQFFLEDYYQSILRHFASVDTVLA